MDELNIEGKEKLSFYNRLFFKLYFNYIFMLLIVVILIGLIFINLYENANNKRHEDQLKRQGITIANRMKEFINYQKYDDFFEYYSILEEMEKLDIWTISNPNAEVPMESRLETTSIDEILDSESFYSIIKRAFMNRVIIETHFDEIYGLNMTTIAVPIAINNEVVGAVVIMSPVDGQKAIVKGSIDLIVKSSIVAIGISFIFMLFFARKLSIPISTMRVTALKLATGDFKAKTNIERKDELGDLSKAIDVLSDKLLASEDYRNEQEQTRQDFFANVSHELRTPITVVRAYTEALVDGVIEDEDRINQYYNRMLSECQNMERLVGDLMLLSKMQNPDFSIEKEQVNLIQVFDDLIRTANIMAEDKNIKIHINKDSDMIMMLGDYGRLRQMFLVIIDNAIKFSDEGKNIYINIFNKDKIIVSIRDEGLGITEEECSKIFDKFYKSSLRQNASGTGLGLTIANQISLKHNGEIEVNSKINKGTEFVFSFPKISND